MNIERQFAARTFLGAYDRAGVGTSDAPARSPLSVRDLVGDLDAFAADAAPPAEIWLRAAKEAMAKRRFADERSFYDDRRRVARGVDRAELEQLELVFELEQSTGASALRLSPIDAARVSSSATGSGCSDGPLTTRTGCARRSARCPGSIS